MEELLNEVLIAVLWLERGRDVECETYEKVKQRSFNALVILFTVFKDE